MEKALKAVYDIHRQSLLETSQRESKFKNLYERLLEKYKKLKGDYDVLQEQNKHLQEVAFNKTTRDGDCCATLRSSLATIGTSYENLVREKDARIKQLEDELRKYKRRSASLGIGSLDFTQDTSSSSARRATSSSPPQFSKDTSPDSTSRTVNHDTGALQTSEKDSTINNHKSADHPVQTDLQPFYDEGNEDLLFVNKSETAAHQPKLRLQKGKLKRSRYSEEVSPENLKRQRSSSSPKPNRSDDEGTKLDKNIKTATSDKLPHPVLVPDTCQPNLDETMVNAKNSKKDAGKAHVNKDAKKDEAKIITKNIGAFPGVQVIPETMPDFTEMDYSDTETDTVEANLDDNADSKPNAKDTPNKSMDVVSDTDESDSEISQCTVKKRNKKITELSMRSVLKSWDSQRSKSTVVEDETDSSSQKKKDKKKAAKSETEKENLNTSTRNILDSPQSQSFTLKDDNDDSEFINHKTLNLSGESEVFELDSDVEQKDEFDDILEKRSSKELDKNSSKNNDKAFEGKSRKKQLLDESEECLRRSPRKLKEVQYYETPKKSKKKLKESSQLTESQIHEMFSSPSSADEDMTVMPTSPTMNDDKSDKVQSIDKQESQSMDCFNIVPVKDGIPISVKKFQLKVPRNKKRGEKCKSVGQNNEIQNEQAELHSDKLTVDNSMLSADLKSPSIIAGRPIENQNPSVVVLSSPSTSSLTDPESPLLLQEKKKEDKTPVKRNNCRKSVLLKSSNKSKDDDTTIIDPPIQNVGKRKIGSPAGPRKSSRSKPAKDLCQTTLTQAFLRSPPRKSQRAKGKVKDTDIDHDLQEAIRLSLEESQNSQPEDEQLNDLEVLDFGTEKENSPPFKRPSTIPRASLRRRNKPLNSDSSETVISKPEKRIHTEVLKEIPDPVNVLENQRPETETHALNGSIDPAAEISALCTDSGSLQTLPSLDKDFQFEELNQGRSVPKTSTLAEEDSQEIASSSRSVTFGTKKKKKHTKTTRVPEDDPTGSQQESPTRPGYSLETSFDHVPKKKGPEIAHVAVVRKRDERQKLKGHSCRECYEYYKAKGLSEEEIDKQIQDCSRHRAKHVKPDTPPHFWSVGFIDTQECVDRGYMQIEQEANKDTKSYRRRKPLIKQFKGKNEVSFVDSDQSDLDD